MFSQKIKKRLGLSSTKSEVCILTPANVLGFTVWSTYAQNYKIDGFTFKNKDG